MVEIGTPALSMELHFWFQRDMYALVDMVQERWGGSKRGEEVGEVGGYVFLFKWWAFIT